MLLTAKRFAEQLNRTLDELGAPLPPKERTVVLSKMLNISRQQAWTLLEGRILPEKIFLEHVLTEFEIDAKLFQN